MPLPNKGRKLLSFLSNCATFEHITQIHTQLLISNSSSDLVNTNINIRLLTRLLSISTTDTNFYYASTLFTSIPNPKLFLFNSLIRLHSTTTTTDPVPHGPQTALRLFCGMHRQGHSPDNFTYPFVLKSCGALSFIEFGRCVHSRIVRTGHETNLYVFSSLIHMYMSCSDLSSAEIVFWKVATVRNVVVWTTMINGYAQNGRELDAIRLFRNMVDTSDSNDVGGFSAEPNEITVVSVLAACGRARDLDSGEWVHEKVRNCWTHLENNVVLDTAIIDMYGKCGSLKFARKLFDEMPFKNEITWNAMITAYNQHGHYDSVIDLFANMLDIGVKPDMVNILALLGACGGKGSRGLGREAHGYVERNIRQNSSRGNIGIYTCIMDMYCKVGDTRSAFMIFKFLQIKDAMVWTSMISGLATHGHGMDAVNLFKEMEKDGVVPDDITFIGVLTGCRHAGLVDEGIRIFSSMKSIYSISPKIEHYGCVIDLLCRAGQLADAKTLVAEMPFKPSAEIWASMLNGCEIHGDVELAGKVGKEIRGFDAVSSGVYVMLSNVYAGAGMWEGVEKARELMRHKGVQKTLGYCCLET